MGTTRTPLWCVSPRIGMFPVCFRPKGGQFYSGCDQSRDTLVPLMTIFLQFPRANIPSEWSEAVKGRNEVESETAPLTGERNELH